MTLCLLIDLERMNLAEMLARACWAMTEGSSISIGPPLGGRFATLSSVSITELMRSNPPPKFPTKRASSSIKRMTTPSSLCWKWPSAHLAAIHQRAAWSKSLNSAGAKGKSLSLSNSISLWNCLMRLSLSACVNSAAGFSENEFLSFSASASVNGFGITPPAGLSCDTARFFAGAVAFLRGLGSGFFIGMGWGLTFRGRCGEVAE